MVDVLGNMVGLLGNLVGLLGTTWLTYWVQHGWLTMLGGMFDASGSMRKWLG